MNALLIHNDNLPTILVEAFESSVKFNIGLSQMMQDGFSFDRTSHEFLERHITSKQFDTIFIPYTLSNQNYLELSGVRLALHIRLTPEFRHTRVPIVFIGHESKEQIAKLTEFPSFLFTSGIFSTDKFEYDSYLKIYDWLINKWKSDGEMAELRPQDYEGFLNRISIDPPSNYLSHHSIDNELALLRWAEYLNCDNRIPEVKENLQTGLYFKYLKALNPVISSGSGNPYLIPGRGKVLLIDDEAEKGWADFYECFFQSNIKNKSIEFEYFKADFKSLSQKEIIEIARKKVEEFDADLVLLDLRLCDSDFNTNPQPEPKELTGYKILEGIKKVNKGIQVVITTASNKVWNYQSTHELTNGYIIKRSDSDVAEDIKNLKKTIETCIKRVTYLKIASDLINSLLKSSDNAISKKIIDKNFCREFSKLLELSFKMYDNAISKDDYAYAYLALFKSLELISDEFTFTGSGTWQVVGPHPLDQYVWDDEQKSYKSNTIPVFKNNRPTTFEKVAGLCFQLWSYNQANVQQLYFSIKRRNEFIHPSENQLTKNLKTECEKVFTYEGYSILLKQIFNIANKILK